MKYVIIRPPLVYGPNCPGNFLALLGLVYKEIPLPIASISNNRSLIGVQNLADFLLECIEKPEAANCTFLISDTVDISTPDLFRTLADSMGHSSFLFPVPYKILSAMATLAGKTTILEKLCGNLQVDSSFAQKTLNWIPPISQSQGLADVAKWYASTKSAQQ